MEAIVTLLLRRCWISARALVLFAVGAASPVVAQTADVVVYYANGILSTPESRSFDLLDLKRRIDGRPEVGSLTIEYKLAENVTAGVINDIVEAADQLGLQSPTVIDLFQGQLISRALGSAGIGSAALGLLQAVAVYLADTDELTMLQGSTLTGQLLQYQNDAQNSGIVIVSHSQGNLFTREAQAALVQQGISTIAVPVGPPDLPIQMIDGGRQRYTLLHEDVVINFGARAAALKFNLTAPPVANEHHTLLPFGLLLVPDCLAAAVVGQQITIFGYVLNDCLFHNFVNSYLEPNSRSERRIIQDAVDAVLLSSPRPTQPVAYSTYLGGPAGGNNGLGGLSAIATDVMGNVVVAGIDGPGFPTVNAIQPTTPDQDIFLTKFDPTGRVVFSTYLGARSANPFLFYAGRESPTAIAISPAGEIYLAGNAPVGFWPLLGNRPVDSGFIMRLDPSGSQIQMFTTQLYDVPGYGYRYNIPYSIRLAPDGNLIVLGCWTFDYGSGCGSPFLAKITPQGARVWQLSLEGLFGYRANPSKMDIDGLGNIYIGGQADSPLVNANPIAGLQLDNLNALILRVDDSGIITGSTLLGGTGQVEEIQSLFIESTGEITVFGRTDSLDFPTTSGVYLTQFPQGNRFAGFVSKLRMGGAPGANSTLSRSTFLEAGAEAAEAAGNGGVLLTGSAGPAFSGTTNATGSSFVARLVGDLSAIDYATRFGAVSGTTSHLIVEGPNNSVVIGGFTGAGLPTSATVQTQFPSFQPAHGGGSDAFVARLAVVPPAAPALGALIARGTVSGTFDPQAVLPGFLAQSYAQGTPFTVEYTFDPATPDRYTVDQPFNYYGDYALKSASITIGMNAPVVISAQSQGSHQINVVSATPTQSPYPESQYLVYAVNHICPGCAGSPAFQLNLSNGRTYLPNDTMPPDAPDVTQFQSREMRIGFCTDPSAQICGSVLSTVDVIELPPVPQ